MIKNHEIYYPLYTDKDHFIILITGGRGSGKSFGVATFIERLTFELKKRGVKGRDADKIVHHILYCRYTMVSASMSVIPEFMEKVEADGTQRYFHATRTDVVNRMTGSKIMFRGLRTSSGNQTARLKSIHGITTFVCDEAEEWTSEREFETIAFSIRQPGIQNRIIIMMNPTDSNHFIYQKYIKDTHELRDYDGFPVQISTHPQVLHIHTTYLDNAANLSEEFIRSAKEMKERDPERYAHIFMGQWADVAEGAIFRKWGIVKEFPENAKKIAAGLDFGFTNDPSACVRCGIVGNDLYLDEVFYEKGMGVNALIAQLKKLGLFVYADSADPRLIQEIANAGIIIYPVAKPAGSIVAGIERMKMFDNIFVTERSLNLMDELRNYVWAKDKDGNYINHPEGGYDHCFTADTLITTAEGEKPIAEIIPGDVVLTSEGWRRVLKTFDNGRKKILHIRLIFSNFTVEIKATPKHKIKTQNGWKALNKLTPGDVLYTVSPLMAESTLAMRKEPISQQVKGSCTAMYGSIITEQSPMDMRFITEIATVSTTTSPIFSWSQKRSTQKSTCDFIGRMWNCADDDANILTTYGPLLLLGTHRQREKNGMSATARRLVHPGTTKNLYASGAENHSHPRLREDSVPINAKPQVATIPASTMKQESARIVERNFLPISIHGLNTVRELVEVRREAKSARGSDSIQCRRNTYVFNVGKNTKLSRQEIISIAAENAGIIQYGSKGCARYAGRNIWQTNTPARGFAVPVVLENIIQTAVSEENVYDLMVETTHEYFANGVLVHNCVDASRYYINGLIMGQIIQPRRVTKSQLGIF